MSGIILTAEEFAGQMGIAPGYSRHVLYAEEWERAQGRLIDVRPEP